MTFSFGDYDIDVERRELRRAKTPVHVEPQVFDLLVYLVTNRDRVVSKDDLIASVWGGRIVSDSTLTSRINAARNAVGDSWRRQEAHPHHCAQGLPLRRRSARAEPASGDEPAHFTISPPNEIQDNRAWPCRCPTGPLSQYFPSSI